MTYPEDPRYDCDLILKGGITSGVVYPPAIVEIAKDHRLRAVGGASAGAIAAVSAAAAELGRASQTGGFARLARVPEELAEVDAEGRTRLRRLFQPQPETAELFDLLWTAWSTRGLDRVRRLLRSLARRGPEATTAMAIAFFAWLVAVGLAIAAFAVAGPGSLLASLPLVLLATLACPAVERLGRVYGGATGLARDAGATVAANLHGLCDGSTPPGASDLALTDWLHGVIQSLAGRDDEGAGDALRATPVTYRELADAGVELATITTDISRGTCERFPLRSGGWAFRESEMRALLPDDVVDHMLAHAQTPKRADVEDALEREGLRLLPRTADLPILLAARISLSFPLLLSAVPLYAWRPRRDGDESVMCFQRCWFSDGGITSNLPVHLFDRPLPRWPTYSINLGGGARAGAPAWANVWRPIKTGDGAQPAIRPIETTTGILSGVFNTMQTWADNSLSRAAGQRDRICLIRLGPGEGGMHLDMPAETILHLQERGTAAGRNLAWIQRGVHPEGMPDEGIRPDVAERQWDRHRFARYRVFLAGLGRYVAEARDVGSAEPDHGLSYAELADAALTEDWLPYRKGWSRDRRARVAEAQGRLFALDTDAMEREPPAGAALGPSAHGPRDGRPRPT